MNAERWLVLSGLVLSGLTVSFMLGLATPGALLPLFESYGITINDTLALVCHGSYYGQLMLLAMFATLASQLSLLRMAAVGGLVMLSWYAVAIHWRGTNDEWLALVHWGIFLADVLVLAVLMWVAQLRLLWPGELSIAATRQFRFSLQELMWLAGIIALLLCIARALFGFSMMSLEAMRLGLFLLAIVIPIHWLMVCHCFAILVDVRPGSVRPHTVASWMCLAAVTLATIVGLACATSARDTIGRAICAWSFFLVGQVSYTAMAALVLRWVGFRLDRLPSDAGELS